VSGLADDVEELLGDHVLFSIRVILVEFIILELGYFSDLTWPHQSLMHSMSKSCALA
jgi:hypothetical protein